MPFSALGIPMKVMTVLIADLKRDHRMAGQRSLNLARELQEEMVSDLKVRA